MKMQNPVSLTGSLSSKMNEKTESDAFLFLNHR